MARFFPAELMAGVQQSIHVMSRGTEPDAPIISDFLVAGERAAYLSRTVPPAHAIIVPVEALDEKNAAQLDAILGRWQARQRGALNGLMLIVEADYYAAPRDLQNSIESQESVFVPLKTETLAPQVHNHAERMLVPELVKYAQEIVSHNHTPPKSTDDDFTNVGHIEAAHDFLAAYDSRRLTFLHTAALVAASRTALPDAERPAFLQDANYFETFKNAAIELLGGSLLDSSSILRKRATEALSGVKDETEYLTSLIGIATEAYQDKGLLKQSLLQTSKEYRGDHYDQNTDFERQMSVWTHYVLTSQFPMLGTNLMQKDAQIVMLNNGITVAEAEGSRSTDREAAKTWGHRKIKDRLEDVASMIVVGDSNQGSEFPFNVEDKAMVLMHEVFHALNANNIELHSDKINEELVQRQDMAQLQKVERQLQGNGRLKGDAYTLLDVATHTIPPDAPFAQKYFKDVKKPTYEEYRALVKGIASHIQHDVIELPPHEYYDESKRLYEQHGDGKRLQDEQMVRGAELIFGLCRTQDDLPNVMKFIQQLMPPVVMKMPNQGQRGNLTFGLERFISHLQQQHDMSLVYSKNKINMSDEIEPLLMTQDKTSHFKPTWERFNGVVQVSDIFFPATLPAIYPRTVSVGPPPLPVALPAIVLPPPYARADAAEPAKSAKEQWQKYLQNREEEAPDLSQKNTDVPPR